MTPWTEIVLRLGAAALIGGAIGLNRDLHHKPSGLRTLALVGLGAALAIMVAGEGQPDAGAASRALQGILTGIGFLGAGVIVHDAGTNRVHGLTTAAAVWVTACLGAACGRGYWHIGLSAVGIAALILLTGGRVERAVHRRFSPGDGERGEPHP